MIDIVSCSVIDTVELFRLERQRKLSLRFLASVLLGTPYGLLQRSHRFSNNRIDCLGANIQSEARGENLHFLMAICFFIIDRQRDLVLRLVVLFVRCTIRSKTHAQQSNCGACFVHWYVTVPQLLLLFAYL